METFKETFRKSERLCSKKAIADLFENGRSFNCYPFQIVWTVSTAEIPSPAQVAISVSKKNFKRAVKRNLIKRRIREVYRKQKHILYEYLELKELKIIFILIFKNTMIPDYSSIQKSMEKIIEKLIIEVGKNLK